MRRMAGWIVVALVVVCVVPAQAQLKFGVKGGVNISTVSFSSDIVNADNITGFQIGPMIEATVPLLGVGFDLGVLYSKKGMSVDNKDISTDYIDIPLNLKWKLDLPLIKPYLAAGPYIGLRVGGDDKWTTLKNQIEAKSFAAGLNFGAGVELLSHLQVGFNYGLGLTENYSAYNLSDVPSYSSSYSGTGAITSGGKNRGWSITAAILF